MFLFKEEKTQWEELHNLQIFNQNMIFSLLKSGTELNEYILNLEWFYNFHALNIKSNNEADTFLK